MNRGNDGAFESVKAGMTQTSAPATLNDQIRLELMPLFGLIDRRIYLFLAMETYFPYLE